MHFVPHLVAVGIVRQARPVECVIWNPCGDIVRTFDDGGREECHHLAVQKLVAV